MTIRNQTTNPLYMSALTYYSAENRSVSDLIVLEMVVEAQELHTRSDAESVMESHWTKNGRQVGVHCTTRRCWTPETEIK